MLFFSVHNAFLLISTVHLQSSLEVGARALHSIGGEYPTSAGRSIGGHAFPTHQRMVRDLVVLSGYGAVFPITPLQDTS